MVKCLRVGGFLWATTLICAYYWRSDALYAITIWPPFVWAGLGFVIGLIGVRRHRNRTQLALLGLWLAFWLGFGEEKRWLPSRLLPVTQGTIEVVSLNCAGGSVDAAREALATKPAIALLQESPSQPELEALVREVYGDRGSVIAGIDASIVVEGKIEPINLNFKQSNLTLALVENDELGSLLVCALRLQPPVFRLDYWNPDCWKSYAENRRLRRQEFLEMAEWVKDLAPTRLIIGGDFNTPPDRGTFSPFDGWVQPATVDSGYSAVNEFPMARIDQIWTLGFTPLRSRADRTVHSDHRIVRAWFQKPATQD